MGRRDELIAKYADDLKNKCGMNPDMELLRKVTIGCGPSIYDADASTVSGLSDPFKYMTDHRLVCTGPWEYSLFGGFVRQERKLVDQEWTA